MKFFVLIFSVLYVSPAHATGTRGGGMGVFCQKPNGGQALESLDAFEARAAGYQIEASKDLEFETQVMLRKLHRAFNALPTNLDPPYPKEVEQGFKELVKKFYSQLEFISQGQRLPSTNDFGSTVDIADCKLVQILVYVDDLKDSGTILVDREYWNLLSPKDQVAFFVHEFIYRALRVYGEKNSLRVRKIVGALLSNDLYPSQYQPLFGSSKMLRCGTAGGDKSGYSLDFYVIPTLLANGKQGSKLVFSTLLSVAALAAMTADSTASFEDWGLGKVAVSEKIFLQSIFGQREAYLEMNGLPSGDPYFGGRDPAFWTLRFKDENGNLLEQTKFVCSNENSNKGRK